MSVTVMIEMKIYYDIGDKTYELHSLTVFGCAVEMRVRSEFVCGQTPLTCLFFIEYINKQWLLVLI